MVVLVGADGTSGDRGAFFLGSNRSSSAWKPLIARLSLALARLCYRLSSLVRRLRRDDSGSSMRMTVFRSRVPAGATDHIRERHRHAAAECLTDGSGRSLPVKFDGDDHRCSDRRIGGRGTGRSGAVKRWRAGDSIAGGTCLKANI